MPLNCGILRYFAIVDCYYEQNLALEMVMSEVSIPGNPADYYKVFTKDDGSNHYQGNRNQIREMMKIRGELTDKCIASGDLDGIERISSDYSDAFEIFIMNEPEEAKIAIYNMLVEELNASADRNNRIANEAYRKIDETNATAENMGKWIGAGILVLFLLFVFASTR
jgi:hypothetical protein